MNKIYELGIKVRLYFTDRRISQTTDYRNEIIRQRKPEMDLLTLMFNVKEVGRVNLKLDNLYSERKRLSSLLEATN